MNLGKAKIIDSSIWLLQINITELEKKHTTTERSKLLISANFQKNIATPASDYATKCAVSFSSFVILQLFFALRAYLRSYFYKS